MTTTLEKIATGFVVIAGVGMYRKLYFASKAANENKKADPDIFFRRIYSVSSLFPLNKNNYAKQDWPLVRKSNMGLVIFYIGLVGVCLLAILQVNFGIKI